MGTFRITCVTGLEYAFDVERSEELRIGQLDMHRAMCSDMDLAGAHFCKTNLSGGFFLSAKLAGAVFESVNLTTAYFDDADLRGAVFNNCNCSGATFRRADLRGVRLIACNLSYADMSHADARGLLLDSVDVRGTKFDEVIVDSEDEVLLQEEVLEVTKVQVPVEDTKTVIDDL